MPDEYRILKAASWLKMDYRELLKMPSVIAEKAFLYAFVEDMATNPNFNPKSGLDDAPTSTSNGNIPVEGMHI